MRPALTLTDLAAETVADAAGKLIARQLATWRLAADHFAAIERVRVKQLDVDGFTYRVQFNPARLTSATAKVDAASIAKRPCFLCEAQLPPEQLGLELCDGFWLLVNPYPILSPHFTIPLRAHVAQDLRAWVPALLRIARLLGGEYALLYNGAQCGASAPDHLHFQAAGMAAMPIFSALAHMQATHGISLSEGLTAVQPPRRPFFVLEGPDAGQIETHFARCLRALMPSTDCDPLRLEQPGHDEPLINVVCHFAGEGWRVILLPRRVHRPRCYFAAEPERLLISPGSLDLVGVCVTPRESDFDRITPDDLRGVLDEVCPDAHSFQRTCERIREDR